MTDFKMPVEFVIKDGNNSIVHDLFKKYPRGRPPTGVAEATCRAAVISESLAHPAVAMRIEEQLTEMKSRRPDEVWIDLMSRAFGENCVAEVRRLTIVDMIFEEWPADGWEEIGRAGAELVGRKIQEMA